MSSGTMRRARPAMAVATLALALAACGGSEAEPGAGASSGTTGSVGVILPDATTSPRWEANDRPSLQKAFDAAGVEANIQNAGGDKAKFGTLCDSMINEGVDVLMIVNLDFESGAACLKKAAAAGIQSIDYDRLTPGGGASYYVSFDNVKVGSLMGEGLEKCLADQGAPSKAGVVYVNGDPTDNNASLFKEGYDTYLKGLGDKVDLLSTDQSGFWDAKRAGTAFDGLYTQFGERINGVVSANDTMAGGIVASLSRNGLAGKVPVTGQDASVEGLQRVLAGTQCMTVYKNTNLEAELAAKLAIAVIQGDTATADSLATTTVRDTVANTDVKSALATPQAIYQDTVKQVVADGFQTAADVCTGEFAAACTEFGVS